MIGLDEAIFGRRLFGESAGCWGVFLEERNMDGRVGSFV